MSAQKFLHPVDNPPVSAQYEANLNGAEMTVACIECDDEGPFISHVRINNLWFWAVEVFTQEAIDELQASIDFGLPDCEPDDYDADAAADAAACRYQRELDAKASQ